MSDLRPRLLMWHRVLAQMTGTISLTYGRDGLKKTALAEWIGNLRNVADDMQAVMDGTSSKLDIETRDVLKSAARTSVLGDPNASEDRQFFNNKGGSHESSYQHPVRSRRLEHSTGQKPSIEERQQPQETKEDELTNNTRTSPEAPKPVKTGAGKVTPKPLKVATRKAGVK